MYVINGKFLGRELNGQIRVAMEIIKALDKMVRNGEFEIVAPQSKYSIKGLKHIKVIRYGKGNIHIWEQTYFAHYLVKNKTTGINILNTHPLLRPDICYIHDVIYKAYPQIYKGIYGSLQKMYTLCMFWTAARLAKKIITVSEFSKNEIVKYYKVSEDRIAVIYNGWQHIASIKVDEDIFSKFSQLEKGNYYLAVSGIVPQKNFCWIIENAKYNNESLYVIVGKKEGATIINREMAVQPNLIYTGRLSDGEIKALMKECRAFIHPAIYEGFALTPLEALSAGAKNVLVTHEACLPEIYGDAVTYIDADNPRIILKSLLGRSKEKDNYINTLLQKYSWDLAAEKLLSILRCLR